MLIVAIIAIVTLSVFAGVIVLSALSAGKQSDDDWRGLVKGGEDAQ